MKKNNAKFKLENFLSGTSQISRIGHLVSILQCIKQTYIFLLTRYLLAIISGHNVSLISFLLLDSSFNTSGTRTHPGSPFDTSHHKTPFRLQLLATQSIYQLLPMAKPKDITWTFCQQQPPNPSYTFKHSTSPASIQQLQTHTCIAGGGGGGRHFV